MPIANDARNHMRALARWLLPPIFYEALRGVRNLIWPRPPEWEYVPEGWTRERGDSGVGGWDVAPVRVMHERVWEAWKAALEGTGALGIDLIRSMRGARSTTPTVENNLSWAHNAVMSYAYVLALSARDRDRLTILDWGGGIGQFYPLSKALIPEVALQYHVKDMPLLCSLGRELNSDVRFHADESWRESMYDLVFASSSLQYSENWVGTLAGLGSVARRYVFITRVPIVFHTPSFVVLQRAEPYGFETQYLGWFLNRAEVLSAGSRVGLELVREFVMMDETPARGAPEQATYRGFLFRTPARGSRE